MSMARSPFICLRCARTARLQSTRPLSTSPSQKQYTTQTSTSAEQLPRWKQTPPALKMPVSVRPRPKQPEWKVNDKPDALDEMYDKFIGKAGIAAKDQDLESTRGRDLLPEEIKWLAITHKSFDHGKRGFNDRMAFLGKRIVDYQTSLGLLVAPSPPRAKLPADEVYQNEALEGLENINQFAKRQVLDQSRLARLARSYGIDKVMRWKPKKSDNLEGSGIDLVLAHTMYSIIGALALQRGGDVAAQTTRERILKPLGLR